MSAPRSSWFLLPLVIVLSACGEDAEGGGSGGAGGAAGAAGGGGAGAAGASGAGGGACVGDEAPGTVTSFAEGLPARTEGITFTSDGRLFVTAIDDIVELHADGTHTVLASVPSSVGIAAWQGALYVAAGDDGTGQGSGTFCADTRRGAVWRVQMDGTAEVFAPVEEPNFIAVSPWGTLLVSNDCSDNTRIFEIDATGAVSTWLDGVPSANGLGFSLDGRTLYAVSTFTDPPPFWRIQVMTDGTPGTPEAVFDFARGSTPDGLAVDAEGNVLVALNLDNQVARVSPAGVSSTLAEAVPFVASLAFGEGAGFDPCSVYATSLIERTVRRVRVGTSGRALYR